MANPAILRLELVGLDEVNKALQQAPEMVRQETDEFFHWAVALMLYEVKKRTPFDSRDLQNNSPPC